MQAIGQLTFTPPTPSPTENGHITKLQERLRSVDPAPIQHALYLLFMQAVRKKHSEDVANDLIAVTQSVGLHVEEEVAEGEEDIAAKDEGNTRDIGEGCRGEHATTIRGIAEAAVDGIHEDRRELVARLYGCLCDASIVLSEDIALSNRGIDNETHNPAQRLTDQLKTLREDGVPLDDVVEAMPHIIQVHTIHPTQPAREPHLEKLQKARELLAELQREGSSEDRKVQRGYIYGKLEEFMESLVKVEDDKMVSSSVRTVDGEIDRHKRHLSDIYKHTPVLHEARLAALEAAGYDTSELTEEQHLRLSDGQTSVIWADADGNPLYDDEAVQKMHVMLDTRLPYLYREDIGKIIGFVEGKREAMRESGMEHIGSELGQLLRGIESSSDPSQVVLERTAPLLQQLDSAITEAENAEHLVELRRYVWYLRVRAYNFPRLAQVERRQNSVVAEAAFDHVISPEEIQALLAEDTDYQRVCAARGLTEAPAFSDLANIEDEGLEGVGDSLIEKILDNYLNSEDSEDRLGAAIQAIDAEILALTTKISELGQAGSTNGSGKKIPAMQDRLNLLDLAKKEILVWRIMAEPENHPYHQAYTFAYGRPVHMKMGAAIARLTHNPVFNPTLLVEERKPLEDLQEFERVFSDEHVQTQVLGWCTANGLHNVAMTLMIAFSDTQRCFGPAMLVYIERAIIELSQFIKDNNEGKELICYAGKSYTDPNRGITVAQFQDMVQAIYSKSLMQSLDTDRYSSTAANQASTVLRADARRMSQVGEQHNAVSKDEQGIQETLEGDMGLTAADVAAINEELFAWAEEATSDFDTYFNGPLASFLVHVGAVHTAKSSKFASRPAERAGGVGVTEVEESRGDKAVPIPEVTSIEPQNIRAIEGSTIQTWAQLYPVVGLNRLQEVPDRLRDSVDAFTELSDAQIFHTLYAMSGRRIGGQKVYDAFRATIDKIMFYAANANFRMAWETAKDKHAEGKFEDELLGEMEKDMPTTNQLAEFASVEGDDSPTKGLAQMHLAMLGAGNVALQAIHGDNTRETEDVEQLGEYAFECFDGVQRQQFDTRHRFAQGLHAFRGVVEDVATDRALGVGYTAYSDPSKPLEDFAPSLNARFVYASKLRDVIHAPGATEAVTPA